MSAPRLLHLGRVTSFTNTRGEPQELRDPDGPATPAQLKALYECNALVVVHPARHRSRFTKAEAAWAVGALEPFRERPA